MGPGKHSSKTIAEKKVLRTVRQTIATHRMLESGDSVLIAVSGGADSVTLVHVLHSLSAEYRLRLAIAHLNHCLRLKESDRDARFVAALAQKLDVPLFLEKQDVYRLHRRAHLSLEEAARKVRYEFFVKTASSHGFNKIATGHHSNDNAELVLMNLLRGSGPLGLSGIVPVRDGNIVRPLIHLKRCDIVEYIAEKKLPFVTDESNTDLSFRRNRIRHHLIPELEKSYNPKIIDTLHRLSRIMRTEDQWIENILRKDFSQCISAQGPDAISLNLQQFDRLATAAKRRLIRQAIFNVKKDLRRITLSHIDAVLSMLDKRAAESSLNLPEGIRVDLKATDLMIIKSKPNKLANSDKSDKPSFFNYQYTITSPGVLPIKEAGVTIKLSEIEVDDLPDFNDAGNNLAFFDMDCLQFPLVVRNMRPGDRFSPLGVNGTQKVKKFFIDKKIPAHQRRLCPLLLSDGQIIWIAGQRIDNCAKIVSATKRILKAELLLA